MLNIKDLESRHAKYKLKSYIPYIISIIILIIIFIVSNITFNTKSTKHLDVKVKEELLKKVIIKKVVEQNITKTKTSPKPVEQIIKDSKIPRTKKVILSPSLNFMRRINTPVNIYTNEEKIYHIKKIANKKEEPKEELIVEETIEIPIIKEKKEPLIIEKKSSLKITINKDQEDIKHVIKRFKVNNNPALSLFVAKKYYQLGDYHKSYNYALITNQLNNNIEASWIIFAKSLMKLNKKDMAINTLKKYIDNSHSPRAKILLDEIQSGKFK